MLCGAPLETMVRNIEDYLQKILNKKLKKEDYEHIIYYIEKQSILIQGIESKEFKVAYFDIAKELLAKPSKKYSYYIRKNKE